MPWLPAAPATSTPKPRIDPGGMCNLLTRGACFPPFLLQHAAHAAHACTSSQSPNPPDCFQLYIPLQALNYAPVFFFTPTYSVPYMHVVVLVSLMSAGNCAIAADSDHLILSPPSVTVPISVSGKQTWSPPSSWRHLARHEDRQNLAHP